MGATSGPLHSPRLLIGRLLGVVCLLAAVLAAWALLTGGFRVHLFGLPLSVRGASRAALVAAISGAIAFPLLDLSQTRSARVAVQVLTRAAPWIAACLAVGVLTLGVARGSRAAAGSDAYGYVSEAAGWVHGKVRMAVPLASSLPWPDAAWTLTPLAYRPETADTLVPTYSPGLPLLMAAATLVAGACGPFLVGPMAGALLVGATYAIGEHLSGRFVGLIAAACVATSPAILIMMLQPMSDVPAAAAWTISVLLALHTRGFAGRAAAGVAAGVAIAIRPNLAPLAAAAAALIALQPPRTMRAAASRLAPFAAACLPLLVLVGWVFNDLYGSPFTSGYGSLGENYWLANARPNIVRYSAWLLDTQGPLVCAFVLSPVAIWLSPDEGRVPRLVCAGFVVAALGSYVLYGAIDAWWSLRYVLPAFPFIFILAADVVATVASRWGTYATGLALATFATFMMIAALDAAERHDVLSIADQEQRYVDAGSFIAQTLPENAIVLSMQHSGSIRYYSGRETLRYDNLPVEWLDRALEHFARSERPVYALLDSWEVPLFEERFRGQQGAQLVKGEVRAASADGRVLLFGARLENGTHAPPIMPRVKG